MRNFAGVFVVLAIAQAASVEYVDTSFDHAAVREHFHSIGLRVDDNMVTRICDSMSSRDCINTYGSLDRIADLVAENRIEGGELVTLFDVDRIGVDRFERLGLDRLIGVDRIDRANVDTYDRYNNYDSYDRIDRIDRVGVDRVDRIDRVVPLTVSNGVTVTEEIDRPACVGKGCLLSKLTNMVLNPLNTNKTVDYAVSTVGPASFRASAATLPVGSYDATLVTQQINTVPKLVETVSTHTLPTSKITATIMCRTRLNTSL